MDDDGSWAFPKEAVAFLRDLKANNDRDWFAHNKSAYTQLIKTPAERFCRIITDQLQSLTGVQHRSKVFRVNRDIRFSKDKTPYNAHLHISFIPESARSTPPAWFFGLQPDGLVVGAGVFAFDRTLLDVYRGRVGEPDGEALAHLLDRLRSGGARFDQPELKRVPAGIPPDHPRAALLRRKGLAGWFDFPDAEQAAGQGVATRCLENYARLKPLFDWLMAL